MKKWKNKLLSFRDASPTPAQTEEPVENVVGSRDFGPGASAPIPAARDGLDRSSTHQSELSKFDYQPELPIPSVLKHARQRSADRRSDPLGLTLLYTPENTPTADIIFVHGLGGTSCQTWSHNRDAELFWPKLWLPKEPDICTARILTFGYNAHFLSNGPNSVSGISDFAKSLLFDLKFGKDDGSEDLGIGKLPIIFVVHSMGGLVFKKAYVQGSNNNDYKDTVSQIRAVLFLSTPHRGTNLADILNRILAVSIFNHAPKQYINELKQNSPILEDINEDFRNHASKLQLFSFYETLETPVGPRNLMVLQKSSATLGYPGEVSEPLNADHHHVCKYQNRSDPSYKSVKSILKTLVSAYRDSAAKLRAVRLETDMQKIAELLGNSTAPEDDYTSLLDRWKPGTGGSMLANTKIQQWIDIPIGSRILWIHAQPGSGKSIKAAIQINRMKENGIPCSYFFFKYGDSTKRSPSSILRSLAFQIAQEVPEFREAMLTMSKNRVRVDKMEARIVWEKLFIATLFKMELSSPLYFIIDALDESDSINAIVGFLSTISASKTPIRVLVTSRKTPEIATAFDRILATTSVTSITATDNLDDIRFYAASEMTYMHGSAEFKQDVINQIVERAEGNFLWVHLALKEIMQCHSPEDIKQALLEMPPGMEALYRRMEASITRLSRESDLKLSRIILAWATFSRRPLHTEELREALEPVKSSIIDLAFTVSQVCGNFVIVDGSSRITLIHQTAREYLVKNAQLPFSLAAQEVQEELFRRTISVFLDSNIRSKLSQKILPKFYNYAATSWYYHLGRSSPGSDSSLTLLVGFFENVSVLYWIRILSTLGDLKVLILASTALNNIVDRRRKLDSATSPSQHRLTDLELLEMWAVDLVKVVGKFGRHLLEDSTAIQKSIPQLCPRNSALFRQFAKQAQISVQGLSNNDWDDSLARLAISDGHHAMKLICSNRYIAVSTSGGTVVLWDSVTFEESRSIAHQEHLFAMCFTEDGRILASYGYHTTRIWDVSTGRQLYIIKNLPDARPLCITFAEDDTKLFVGLSSRRIADLSWKEDLGEWNIWDPSFLQEDAALDGTYLNAPTAMAFNGSCRYIAVAYRGYPLVVWGLTERSRIKKCRRKAEHDHSLGEVWSGVNRVVWHPLNEEVLGIYTDGNVFKWSPFVGFHEELQTDSNASPSEIQCSPNGVLFATSDVNGTVKLYNYEYFSLIYQLSSEDIITSLCFSPESRRFYDLRGSYCNVWEPNALFRLPDTDERGSDIDTEVGSMALSHHPSESWAELPVPIRALCATSQGGMFCTGNDEGRVELHDISTQEVTKAGQSRGDDSIGFIDWATNGEYFAFADSDVVTVNKVLRHIIDRTKLIYDCQSIVTIDMDLEGGKLTQILLHPDAHYVITTDSDTSQLWSTESKKLCKTLAAHSPRKWARHPLEPKQVLEFTPNVVAAYTWDDLEILAQWQITTPAPLSKPGETAAEKERPTLIPRKSSARSEPHVDVQEYVDEVIISSNQEYVLVLISEHGGTYRRPWSRLHILELAHLRDAEALNIDPLRIPDDIQSMMERPLGIIGKDQLVFFDRSFWVCTWRLRSQCGSSSVVQHFFLPRDWVSVEVLDMCHVLADGIFLCPRKGQVAVIRSSLGRDW